MPGCSPRKTAPDGVHGRPPSGQKARQPAHRRRSPAVRPRPEGACRALDSPSHRCGRWCSSGCASRKSGRDRKREYRQCRTRRRTPQDTPEKDQGIAADPHQSHQSGAPVCTMDGGDFRGLAGGAMPPGKDLLTAQTLHAGGKETHDHGDHQQAPHHRQGGAAEGPVQVREKLIRCGQSVKKQCAEGRGSGGKTPEGIVSGFGGMCHRAASFRTAGRRASSHWARSLYTVSRHVSKRISCRSWG